MKVYPSRYLDIQLDLDLLAFSRRVDPSKKNCFLPGYKMIACLIDALSIDARNDSLTRPFEDVNQSSLSY